MIEQFKTIEDLEVVIKEYEKIMLRPTRRLSHPTLYRKRDVGTNEVLIKGVRFRDWLFSEDLRWVKPHDQMGLSFCSTFSKLKSTFKLKQKHNEGKRMDVFWILEKADIPSGFKFVEDRGRKKKGHFFLTVTEPMQLESLVSKLKLLARRLTVIRNGGKSI